MINFNINEVEEVIYKAIALVHCTHTKNERNFVNEQETELLLDVRLVEIVACLEAIEP